ncbi:Diaminopimelate epimerase [Candidatus Terasakiella magnetica]|uniref:Diaminopimelate epimerase n=1 Tax=Candidatus Terasakiella magnetica TaxID=1867952 RepID=A0A1C3RGZ5_9PROT|nr:diaminopimelate epimerase [Candidatus Terasakiella magnetica]SCA56472.1 Diaminopimelate epimerase [Candidatus Terasakiella magnetica]
MLPFIKMHGLGNDFVVLDARETPIELSVTQVQAMADRRTGAGCDQFIVMEPAKDKKADVFMRIRNADGNEVEACGNATRCIARIMMDETGKSDVVVETVVGLLHATQAHEGSVTVNMGPARLGWEEIPTAAQCDTLNMPVTVGPLESPVGVNVGNPHAVYFVEDAESIDLVAAGPHVETHPFFPDRINVEVVSKTKEGALRMRVWERGVGITQACGTGACATVVAAVRRGVIEGRCADVVLDGGTLNIEWLENGEILMTGPASRAFSGTFHSSVYPGA